METTNCCNTILCENPLIELYRKVTSVSLNSDPELDLGSALEQVLTNGLFLSNHGKYCCPDCNGKKGFYFLGSLSIYEQVSTLFGQVLNPEDLDFVPTKYPCCLNHYLTSDGSIEYKNLYGTVDPPCCDTNFIETVDDMLSMTALPTLGNIIEAGTFNGSGGLSALIEYIDLENTEFEFDSLALFFTKLMELGVVIKCFDCDIFIGDFTAFAKFGAAYNVF